MRNTNQGNLTAEAELIHRGRTTIVANMGVADDRARLVDNIVVTLLVPPGAKSA
jgi:acyl-coenzyme A thioesterase PaaI-like protein